MMPFALNKINDAGSIVLKRTRESLILPTFSTLRVSLGGCVGNALYYVLPVGGSLPRPL